ALAALGGRRRAVGRRRTAGTAGLRTGLFVHHARDAVRFLLELLERSAHGRVVLLLDGAPALGDDRGERRDIALGQLLLVLGERLFERVAEVVELVPTLDLLALLLVLGLVCRGLVHHALDLVLLETARRRDRDPLVLAGRRVLRVHAQDAVRVDVERHLDLRHA